MTGHMCSVVILAGLLAGATHARSDRSCNIRVGTEAGYVCGLQRFTDDNVPYASFRGVPYAKPPTNERRFKELEPLDATDTIFALNEGPICLQTDVLYGKIMQNNMTSEDCIYANIHVPLHALPNTDWTPAIELQVPRVISDECEENAPSRGLPILVFIHGGGFAFGSGDTDLYGPEYLVSKNVIVITFNYRLNVFGFLSLNSSQVPGNAGLRDMVTLLQWVQRNARCFGGDPDNVTLGGQSAGAIAAHLLTLSKAAEGLFKRAILMSGMATSSFYSPSPLFAQFIKKQLLAILQITATDPDEIYQQLLDLPAEKLVNANQFLLEQTGFTTFVPTVESLFPGVTPILDDYPENLIAKGRGKNIPLLVGYTNSECETFRNRLEKFDIVQKSKENPAIIIPPKFLFSVPHNLLLNVTKKIDKKYYHGTISVDGFVEACSEGFFEYPLLKVVDELRKVNAAPVYAYKFSYESTSSILKKALGLKYDGAAHVEDMTYVFKTNSVVEPSNSGSYQADDDNMKNFMTSLVVNFMICSKPVCNGDDRMVWPAANRVQYLYQDIQEPYRNRVKEISRKQQDIVKFYDSLTIVE